MRKLLVIAALLLLTSLGAGYAVAQDQPATPPTYLVDCASPEAGAIASPDTLTDPTVEDATGQETELLEMNATPDATPGQFACATPFATPGT